jgi:hypothetical protein
MTLAELTNKLNAAKFRRTVLGHMIEHLDAEFLVSTGDKPQKALLTEDKVRVPQQAFEEILEELSHAVKSLMEEEQNLLASEVALKPPAEVTPETEAKS